MVGGYQIIDASDFIEYNGVYIPKREYKWSLKKPIRLIGLKGKSTTDPDLDFIIGWNEVIQTGVSIGYTYADSVQNITVAVTLSDEDIFGGAGDYPVHCFIGITET